MTTYNNIYLDSRKKLIAAGVEDAGKYARILLSSATGKSVETVLRDLNLYTTDEVKNRVEDGTGRLIKGEPLEYITGTSSFYGLEISVNKNVLIPRPDTEVLVNAAREILFGNNMNARILDLCTGSGCISCALASIFPASRIVAVDINEDALETCRGNVSRLGYSGQIVCMQADAMQPPPIGIGAFDIIVCNPPYIETEIIKTLDDSVKKFEPKLALDGGKDGLKFYRSIIKFWRMQLLGGGHLLFEVGEDQAEPVAEMLMNAGFTSTEFREDSGGCKRIVIGLL